MSMTSEEMKTADDFERGWSDERLEAAEFRWGSGVTNFLPYALGKKITERADADGISELELIQVAITDYLGKGTAA